MKSWGGTRMGLFAKRKEGYGVQTARARRGNSHPFGMLENYVPMGEGEIGLYRAIREAVPMVDAAIFKLIRLCGGVRVKCCAEAQGELDRFLETVPTGYGQVGLQSFLDCYLDSMLVCGRAVGEMVLTPEGDGLAALLCGRVEDLIIREGENPLDLRLCVRGSGTEVEELPYQRLLLFTPYQPETACPYGVSLLRSMPFLTGVLLKIYQAERVNWERLGNPRFAVICKPDGTDFDARERCDQIARAWEGAMKQTGDGSVSDFVAAGELEIKVIGADGQVMDSTAPVRQILEQLVAKTGLPPFLLGLSWSSTERMSSQQADMLTSEITAIRRSLTPVVARICRMWLRLRGCADDVQVEWEDITLQDLVEEARAGLYHAQREKLEEELRKEGCR